MRHIYRYTEQAKKHLSSLLKVKMPKAEPWLHVAVKTWSNRNPWSGCVVYVWDTRQVVWEHRCSKNDIITNEKMKQIVSGMNYAQDNRQPLVGGRKDINEFFEFGDKFDASRGSAFDGKDRIESGNIYARRSKLSKPAEEFNVDSASLDELKAEYKRLDDVMAKYRNAASWGNVEAKERLRELRERRKQIKNKIDMLKAKPGNEAIVDASEIEVIATEASISVGKDNYLTKQSLNALQTYAERVAAKTFDMLAYRQVLPTSLYNDMRTIYNATNTMLRTIEDIRRNKEAARQ